MPTTLEHPGPEPTGWELLRAIGGLRSDIHEISEKVVPLALYTAEKHAHEERQSRAEARLKNLEGGLIEAEKLRRQQRLTITLAIAAPVVAFTFTLLRDYFPAG